MSFKILIYAGMYIFLCTHTYLVNTYLMCRSKKVHNHTYMPILLKPHVWPKCWHNKHGICSCMYYAYYMHQCGCPYMQSKLCVNTHTSKHFVTALRQLYITQNQNRDTWSNQVLMMSGIMHVHSCMYAAFMHVSRVGIFTVSAHIFFLNVHYPKKKQFVPCLFADPRFIYYTSSRHRWHTLFWSVMKKIISLYYMYAPLLICTTPFRPSSRTP